MGAVRPQTPHRSPRQAFGGNLNQACLRQAEQKKNVKKKLECLHARDSRAASAVFGIIMLLTSINDALNINS